MVPTLFRLGELAVPTHDVFVVLGVGAALGVFGWANRTGAGHDPRLWQIAAGGLLLGAVFARVSTGWRYLAATPDASLAGLWLAGGKSVLGGLAGAYLGVHLTKRLIGYRERTGDVFAPAVALGLAIGRVGCFLTEPIGRPTSLPWGITPDPAVAASIPGCTTCMLGVPLHPSFLYEIVFHVIAFVVLVRYGPRLRAPGETFTLYLLAYGLVRFLVEFTRDSAVMAAGLTGSQLFLLATLPLLLLHVARQLRRGAYVASHPPSSSPAGSTAPPTT